MTFTQGLHRALQSSPDAVAVIDGERQLTFAEIAQRVARLAGGLRELGVERGDRVAILATNRLEYIEFVLLCSWLGVVSTPVNNRWSTAEAAFQIDHTEAKILIVDQERMATAQALRDQCASLRTIVSLDPIDGATDLIEYSALVTSSEPVADVRPSAEELAVLMYTGGTTGLPKGVMLTYGQVMASLYGAGLTIGGDPEPEVALWTGPMFHMAAYAGVVHQLALGSTHVLIGDFDVARLAEVVAEQRITLLSLVPTTIKWLLDYAQENSVDLSSLRMIGYGTAPMPIDLVHRLRETIPGVALRQAYGMTELAPVATILRDADHRAIDHPERLRSVGRAALHAELRVVDADDEDRPIGEVGEVIVRGAHVMQGYWKDPETTAQTLRGGWMHTGDMGYLDKHGYLYLVDRLKDMIVSGGENVYSTEVERVIYDHPAVASCAVIGVPDDDWGERVHAVVVLKSGAALEGAQLREFVGERIARYKAPRSMSVVDELPLSPVGKILKRELRNQFVS